MRHYKDDGDRYVTFTDEHLQKLYRYGISLTQNEAHAYDILQYALENDLRKPADNETAAISCIRKIMRNRYIDEYRRSSRFPLNDIAELDETVSIDARLLEDIVIINKVLETAWSQLDMIEREILFLWAVENLSATDIANELDIPRGTVLSRIYRLRQRIKDMDESEYKNRDSSNA